MIKEKRFNVEEHPTLDGRVIDVFPISHRYIHDLEQQVEKLQKDIKNIIKILEKNCDELEATEEEFDSLDRWQGLQTVKLEHNQALLKENQELKKRLETYEIESYKQDEELNKMSFDIRK